MGEGKNEHNMAQRKTEQTNSHKDRYPFNSFFSRTTIFYNIQPQKQ